MRSIKPGRGPSRKAYIGSVFGALFGVFWTILACSMGAIFMVPFGLIFIGMSIYNASYAYHNMTSRNRYSSFDIVEDGEEEDPFDQEFKRHNRKNYCPYCGNDLDNDFKYCPFCGREIR